MEGLTEALDNEITMQAVKKTLETKKRNPDSMTNQKCVINAQNFKSAFSAVKEKVQKEHKSFGINIHLDPLD